jgi:hypothetical protein
MFGTKRKLKELDGLIEVLHKQVSRLVELADYLHRAHIRNRVKVLGLADHLGVRITHAEDYTPTNPIYAFTTRVPRKKAHVALDRPRRRKNH